MPGRQYAGGSLGTILAGLRRSVGFGDVSCRSDHTNLFLLAMFSHEERLAPVVEF